MDLWSSRRKYVFLALLAPLALRAAEERAIELSVVKRKAEGGVRTVRVARGGKVTLKVRSDEALALHVHGYDVQFRVTADAPASVSFTAAIVGRFPVTAHLHAAGSGAKAPEPTLLYLEVHPE